MKKETKAMQNLANKFMPPAGYPKKKKKKEIKKLHRSG